MAIEDDILAAVQALDAKVGTPVDTTIATDIANVQTAIDGVTALVSVGSAGLLVIDSFDRQDSLAPNGQQNITGLNSVKTLTVPAGTRAAFVRAETKGVRFTNDGTTPSASVGVLIPADSAVLVNSPAILSTLKFIEVEASATLSVAYFK